MQRAWLAALTIAVLLAGCSESPAPAPAPPATEPVRIEEAVDWSQTMSSRYCVNASGAVACGSGISVMGFGSGEATPTYVHDSDGRLPAGGALTLEWEAAAPSTETLRVVVSAYADCPDDCVPLRSISSAIGQSPLAILVDPLVLGPDEGVEGLAVVVRVEPVEFVAGTELSVGQPVHLTGMLSFLEPVPGGDAAQAARVQHDEANA
jgi:hypothetical protein